MGHHSGCVRPQSSQAGTHPATHPASRPPLGPPECPDLTQHFALKISKGFKGSSLDSIQMMFLLGVYTGGKKARGWGPTTPPNEATFPAAWPLRFPRAAIFLLSMGKMPSPVHPHTGSGVKEALGVCWEGLTLVKMQLVVAPLLSLARENFQQTA